LAGQNIARFLFFEIAEEKFKIFNAEGAEKKREDAEKSE
jgi:hypothetical protein